MCPQKAHPKSITGINGAHYLLRLIMVGDCAVGKSCMMMRFNDETFVCRSGSYVATIGIDFKVKTVEMGGKLIKLQIWDTAGQERFQAINVAYYRSASGIILVYDVTSQLSFDHVSNWIRQIKTHAPDNVDCILVGNKCDLEEERVVSTESGAHLAQQHGMEFLETSVVDNINVKEVFAHITRTVIRRVTENPNFDSAYDPSLTLDASSDEDDDDEDNCCF